MIDRLQPTTTSIDMTKLQTRTFLPAKSLTRTITWLLCVMVVSVFGCLVYFLNSLDNLAADELAHRVHLAIKLEKRIARDSLEEYSFWDVAYQKLEVERDLDWAKTNSGDYLMDKHDFDFSVAVTQQDQEIYLIKSDDAQAISFNDLKQPLLESMSVSKKLTTENKLTNSFYRIGQNVYHIVGGPFVSEQTRQPHKGTYLALGKRIDADYLRVLENDYQLFGLNLTNSSEGLTSFTTLYSPSGQVVAYLSWKPHVPSKAIIPAITLITILFAFIITAVTMYILKKEQVSREEYEGQLFEEATTDPLTKVKNRRYFMMVGVNEFNTCRLLAEKQLSVLVLDIDYFKNINDQFGHSVGDKALTHFTQVCATGLRKTDIFGRIGGEEFAVIMPLTNEKKAEEIANKIRVLIEKSPCLTDDKLINLTVSIGVAVFNQQDNFEALLEEADKALYDAKHQGRNQVIIYHDYLQKVG
ncbi:diguanylate cyclase [Vibrio sp. EA2]|uniref:sensor domain-containing diguanylate cyclase n=1 Tax=Vibrio sp. EA2 TaxID=3079860 RepID=UPI002949C0A9|nr:diguanylate cyclase [Vibrio sp. EA2]MDV6250097.1 diguanylate cyclase [Vibrio sp. EA2]